MMTSLTNTKPDVPGIDLNIQEQVSGENESGIEYHYIVLHLQFFISYEEFFIIGNMDFTHKGKLSSLAQSPKILCNDVLMFCV